MGRERGVSDSSAHVLKPTLAVPGRSADPEPLRQDADVSDQTEHEGVDTADGLVLGDDLDAATSEARSQTRCL